MYVGLRTNRQTLEGSIPRKPGAYSRYARQHRHPVVCSERTCLRRATRDHSRLHHCTNSTQTPHLVSKRFALHHVIVPYFVIERPRLRERFGHCSLVAQSSKVNVQGRLRQTTWERRGVSEVHKYESAFQNGPLGVRYALMRSSAGSIARGHLKAWSRLACYHLTQSRRCGSHSVYAGCNSTSFLSRMRASVGYGDGNERCGEPLKRPS